MSYIDILKVFLGSVIIVILLGLYLLICICEWFDNRHFRDVVRRRDDYQWGQYPTDWWFRVLNLWSRLRFTMQWDQMDTFARVQLTTCIVNAFICCFGAMTGMHKMLGYTILTGVGTITVISLTLGLIRHNSKKRSRILTVTPTDQHNHDAIARRDAHSHGINENPYDFKYDNDPRHFQEGL